MDEALRVQEEVSDLQLRIEEIQGRLNFLKQTAAYSLIEVSLKLTAEVMEVDAGDDVSFRVGQVARFRASFTRRRPLTISHSSGTSARVIDYGQRQRTEAGREAGNGHGEPRLRRRP